MKRFMKLLSGLLSLTVALTIALSIPSSVRTYAAQGETFPDIKTHWGRASIEYATGKGIISGYPNGNYGPDDTITVEQFIILLVRTLGRQDVPLGLDNYIAAAQELGILQVGEHYNYKSPILRGDMAKMAIRAYETLNEEVTYPQLLEAFKGLVTDYNSISDTLKASVLKCVEQGIIVGGDGGNFNENSTSTRAQAASVIHRLLSEEERARVKPVFAEPDYEFEAYMNGGEAWNAVSTEQIKIQDGIVYWNGSYGGGPYGLSILPTYHNKESNKIAYETIKNMVAVARENGRYLNVIYHNNYDDTNEVRFEYFRNTKTGQANIQGAEQFCVTLYAKPYKWYGMNQTKFSFYDVSIGHLADYNILDERIDADILLALNTLIDSVFGKAYSEYLNDYILSEFNKIRDYLEGIRDVNELDNKYIIRSDDGTFYSNSDLLYYKDIEICNLGQLRVSFSVGK